MKSRLGTLIERDAGGGRTYMSGKLGEAMIVVEPDGLTRDGAKRWRLMLATPQQETSTAVRNRRGASWRIERRKAEQVQDLGGQD